MALQINSHCSQWFPEPPGQGCLSTGTQQDSVETQHLLSGDHVALQIENEAETSLCHPTTPEAATEDGGITRCKPATDGVSENDTSSGAQCRCGDSPGEASKVVEQQPRSSLVLTDPSGKQAPTSILLPTGPSNSGACCCAASCDDVSIGQQGEDGCCDCGEDGCCSEECCDCCDGVVEPCLECCCECCVVACLAAICPDGARPWFGHYDD